MKNKKIILGLGTITALGAMSVGFIACVKKPEVEKIVKDKTKDLSKLKKDDLNDKFKTLEDEIATLKEQLKEATDKNKKDIDSLSKQLLDKEIQIFEANVENTFGKDLNEVKFKKAGHFNDKKEENTGQELFERIKSNFPSFDANFKIVNEDDLKKQITEDKFKLKIVAKGRSATNSPLFVKEIEIKFFDVLVDDNLIIKQAKDDIQGLKDKAAVDAEIEKITLPANQDIEKLEVDSVSGIDATIKVTMKKKKDGKAKTIDKNTFVIEGAIAPTLLRTHMDGLKITNKTTDEQIIAHLNKQELFKNISSNDITIERTLADKENDGKIKIKSNKYSDSVKKLKIQGDIEIKINQLEKLALQSIKNKITGINNLDSLEKVNEALAKIKIDGVTRLEAKLNKDSKTDVVITITPEEDTHYIDDKDKEFIITGAIKKTEDKKDEAKEGQN